MSLWKYQSADRSLHDVFERGRVQLEHDVGGDERRRPVPVRGRVQSGQRPTLGHDSFISPTGPPAIGEIGASYDVPSP